MMHSVVGVYFSNTSIRQIIYMWEGRRDREKGGTGGRMGKWQEELCDRVTKRVFLRIAMPFAQV